jgi:hypothetical protein
MKGREMPSSPKKKVVKQAEKADTVQMIADGSNKVLLVFPKGSKLKGTKTLSAAQVSKTLGVRPSRSAAEVEGQCRWVHRCPPDIPPVD